MAIIEILLPKMGESVAEATITNLLVEPGSSVEADETIVEIATDKVDSEVPAPEDGVLVEWLIAEGDVVPVGAPIAKYEVGGEAGDSAPATAPAVAPAPAALTPATPAPDVVDEVDEDQQKGVVLEVAEVPAQVVALLVRSEDLAGDDRPDGHCRLDEHEAPDDDQVVFAVQLIEVSALPDEN